MVVKQGGTVHAVVAALGSSSHRKFRGEVETAQTKLANSCSPRVKRFSLA